MTSKQLAALKSAWRAMMVDYSDAYKERAAAREWYYGHYDNDSYKDVVTAQVKMDAIISCADKIGELLWDIDHGVI